MTDLLTDPVTFLESAVILGCLAWLIYLIPHDPAVVAHRHRRHIRKWLRALPARQPGLVTKQPIATREGR